MGAYLIWCLNLYFDFFHIYVNIYMLCTDISEHESLMASHSVLNMHFKIKISFLKPFISFKFTFFFSFFKVLLTNINFYNICCFMKDSDTYFRKSSNIDFKKKCYADLTFSAVCCIRKPFHIRICMK